MKKPLFNKICIVGVGLIGGSLGLAIRQNNLAKEVVGVSRRSWKLGKIKGVIDQGYFPNEIGEALKDADLVVLALPVQLNLDFIKKNAHIVGNKALVMDVGSTKSDICKAGKAAFGSRFIGCHPMAGSEKRGVEFADKNLFKKSFCFVSQNNSQIKHLWNSVGAKTILIDPKVHDHWAAKASHLPHILSFALMAQINGNQKVPVNPSLKNFIRLAKSDPKIWTHIFLSNQKEILNAIDSFKTQLDDLEKKIGRRSSQDIHNFILLANRHSIAMAPDEI